MKVHRLVSTLIACGLLCASTLASAYDADVTGERPDEDWQRVYDAVVEVGGATTARDAHLALLARHAAHMGATLSTEAVEDRVLLRATGS